MKKPEIYSPTEIPERWAGIVKHAEDYMHDLFEEDHHEEDSEHRIYEQVMLALYGEGVFRAVDDQIDCLYERDQDE